MRSDYKKQAENLLFMLNEVFAGQRAELIETALRQVAEDARKEEREACARACDEREQKALQKEAAAATEYDRIAEYNNAMECKDCAQVIRNRG